VAYYVVFLLDLANAEQRIVRPSHQPDPTIRPTNAFLWKVICDAENQVVVHAIVADGGIEVIATARWRDGMLRDLAQETELVPTGYQWSIVENAVREELAKCTTPSDSVEDIAGIDANFVKHEQRDWTEAQARSMTAQAKSTTAKPKPKDRLGNLVVGAVVAIVLLAGIITYVKLGRKPAPIAKAPRDAAVRIATPQEAIPQPPSTPDPWLDAHPERVPNETPATRIAKATSFQEAIAIAKPEMTVGEHQEITAGATLLATYASAKLRWADVEKPETSFVRAEKDVDLERGKRMCATGKLLRIEKRDLAGRKIYVGELSTAEADIVTFVAVGTTGDLFKRMTATFCGVVTGKLGSYVALLGMFDLPENRHPIVEQ
jgi:hypothetical protein